MKVGAGDKGDTARGICPLVPDQTLPRETNRQTASPASPVSPDRICASCGIAAIVMIAMAPDVRGQTWHLCRLCYVAGLEITAPVKAETTNEHDQGEQLPLHQRPDAERAETFARDGFLNYGRAYRAGQRGGR